MFDKPIDCGPEPLIVNVEEKAIENDCFRKALWTGRYAQMTLMSIPPCVEVGLEIHRDTDQIITVQHGCALVRFGKCECRPEDEQMLEKGDTVFIPAGTWHNIINKGRCDMKLSSVYAPPHHPRGLVQSTKEEADKTDAYQVNDLTDKQFIR